MALRQWSPRLAAIWSDGLYLTAWPRLALLLPFLAVLIGFGEGSTHWSLLTVWEYKLAPDTAITFVQMVPLLCLAVLAGTLSAQIGFLLVVGYAAGDMLLHGPGFRHGPLPFLGWVQQIGLPGLISYLLFFMLTVQPILTARLLTASLGRLVRGSGAISFWFAAALSAGLQALIVYAWTMAAPMVVRPIWLWASEGYPPLTVPYFMSVVDPWMPILAGGAALLRAGLVWRVRRDKFLADAVKTLAVAFRAASAGQSDASPLLRWVRVVSSAAVMTLRSAGFIKSPERGVVGFCAFMAILALQTMVVPRVPGWLLLTGKFPLLVRWAAVIVCGYLAAQSVYLSPSAGIMANQGPGDFVPELLSLALGLIFAALLIPAPGRSSEPPFTFARLNGRTARQSIAAVLLLAVLTVSRPALAYCADSMCCFVSNGQAMLAIAAFLLFLTPLLLPEELALVGIADLAEFLGVQVEREGLRAAEREISDMISQMASDPGASQPYINNPQSLEGRSYEDVKAELDQTLEQEGGWTKSPMKDGGGLRYYDGKGNYVQITRGYPKGLDGGGGDLVHQGPYVKIQPGGTRVPLAGNPALPKGEQQ